MARVMVVEDDTDVSEWIAHCLRQDGHTIVPVRDAAEALERAATDPGIDLVVLDYALPDLDGVEVLGRLRESRPGLPALFVTVQWSGQIIDRMLATGAEHISKPFEPERLVEAVRRALVEGPDGGAGATA